MKIIDKIYFSHDDFSVEKTELNRMMVSRPCRFNYRISLKTNHPIWLKCWSGSFQTRCFHVKHKD